jgi:hypothetical protein
MINIQSKSFLVLFTCLFTTILLSQKKDSRWQNLRDTKINISKSGPYVGLQKGQFMNFEIGYEYQWKKVKLVKPKTNSLHLGISYNYFNNVLGYEFGYYNKTGRANFTYGINSIYLTDFVHNRIGITPVIGYKLFGFHIQAGYNLLAPVANFKKVNSPFLSLRFFILNKRDIDFKN